MLLQELSHAHLFDRLREMDRLHQFNRLLEGSRRSEFPPINVWIGEEAAHVTAEIPGISAEDIDISVVNDTLTLRGCRTPEDLQEDETLHRKERGYGRFSRTIELPFKVAAEKVEANFRKGVLNITLPCSEQDKPRKISVRAD